MGTLMHVQKVMECVILEYQHIISRSKVALHFGYSYKTEEL